MIQSPVVRPWEENMNLLLFQKLFQVSGQLPTLNRHTGLNLDALLQPNSRYLPGKNNSFTKLELSYVRSHV